MGAVDMGIYAQTLALLLSLNGIASWFQGTLGQFPDPVKEMLKIPGDEKKRQMVASGRLCKETL